MTEKCIEKKKIGDRSIATKLWKLKSRQMPGN